MEMQSQGKRGARTFVLGMLAGASIVAGGVVLAGGHNLIAAPTVMIQTESVGVAAAPPVSHAVAESPPVIDLPRAVVIGHRLKSLVRSEPVLSPALSDLNASPASMRYS